VSVVVERLAGSFLVRGEGRFELVGQPKMPCDWSSVGFEKPTGIDAPGARRAELVCLREPELPGPRLIFDRPFDVVANAIASRLVVARNGSASERLWSLVLDADDPDDLDASLVVDATWVIDMPERAFGLIRDNVLRCL